MQIEFEPSTRRPFVPRNQNTAHTSIHFHTLLTLARPTMLFLDLLAMIRPPACVTDTCVRVPQANRLLALLAVGVQLHKVGILRSPAIFVLLHFPPHSSHLSRAEIHFLENGSMSTPKWTIWADIRDEHHGRTSAVRRLLRVEESSSVVPSSTRGRTGGVPVAPQPSRREPCSSRRAPRAPRTPMRFMPPPSS